MNWSRRVLISLVVLSVAMVGQTSDWVRLGPDRADVRVIAAHPTDPNVVLLYGDDWYYRGNGMYRSDDGGQSFYRTGLRGHFATVIRFAPSDPSVVYVGLGRQLLEEPSGGVFRSDDGGRSWVSARAGLENPNYPPDLPGLRYWAIKDLAVDPADPSKVWASTSFGLFASVDSGESWDPVMSTWGNDIRSVVVSGSSPRTLLVCWDDRGVRRSFDGGLTWENAWAGLEEVDEDTARLRFPIQIVKAPWDPEVLFGKMASSELFWYDKDANQWFPVESLDSLQSRGPYNRLYISEMTAGPDGSQDLWFGSHWNGAIRSTDGGESWFFTDSLGLICVQNPPSEPDNFVGLSNLAVLAGDGSRLLASSTFGTILRSEDSGASWTQVSDGLAASHPVALLLDPDDPDRLLAGTNAEGLHVSIDAGVSWDEVLSHQVFPCDSHGPNPFSQPPPDCWTWADIRRTPDGRPIVRGDCGMYVSPDRGLSWTAASDSEMWPLGNTESSALWYGQSDGEIFKGDGQPDGWTACGQLPANQWYLEHVLVSDQSPEMAIAVTDRELFRSTDGCATWYEVGQDMTACSEWSHEVVSDPHNDGRILFSDNCGIWLSVDHGETWDLIAPDQPYMLSVLFDPNRPGVVFGSGYHSYGSENQSGLVISYDGGLSWQPFVNNRPDVFVPALALKPDSSVLYAAVYGDGVYRIELAPWYVPEAESPESPSQ